MPGGQFLELLLLKWSDFDNSKIAAGHFTHNYGLDHAWAYPIVSIMFYFYHGSFATLQHFVMSMVFCWAYARYETLWAPILLHMLQNIPHVVAVIWEHVNNII